MKISGHYAGFPEKTLVVITNHERARIFLAHGHDFLEQKAFTAPQDISDAEEFSSFFQSLHAHMEKLLHTHAAHSFLVCVPEVHRPLFHENLPPTIAKKIQRVIPKNLSAMEEGPIIRILFEG